MNREIKFRAWIQVGDEGRMFTPTRMHYHAEATKYVSRAGFSATDPATSFVSYNVMQFTGLQDNGGRDIYEGDIVRGTGGEFHQGYYQYDYTGVMKWQGCGFDLVYRNGQHEIGCGLGFADGLDSFHIIGNVFENPELMEQPQPSDTDASDK